MGIYHQQYGGVCLKKGTLAEGNTSNARNIVINQSILAFSQILQTHKTARNRNRISSLAKCPDERPVPGRRLSHSWTLDHLWLVSVGVQFDYIVTVDSLVGYCSLVSYCLAMFSCLL
jgi:hypothetical protein